MNTATTRKPAILRVWIEHKLDSDADTSHMGEYSSVPANDFAIDRQELGHMRRNDHRWFNPSFNYVTPNGKPGPGLTPADVRNYTRQDYDRMEALNRGEWHYIGIIAKAEVQLTGDLVQVLRSGGLWGVESDANAEHTKQIEAEELSNLRHELEAVGFSKRAIAHAFARFGVPSTPSTPQPQPTP